MINNTTIHSRIFENFTHVTQNVTYMSVSDIHDVDTLITFYSGCLNYYPHIFLPAMLLGAWLGYKLIKQFKGSDKS